MATLHIKRSDGTQEYAQLATSGVSSPRIRIAWNGTTYYARLAGNHDTGMKVLTGGSTYYVQKLLNNRVAGDDGWYQVNKTLTFTAPATGNYRVHFRGSEQTLEAVTWVTAGTQCTLSVAPNSGRSWWHLTSNIGLDGAQPGKYARTYQLYVDYVPS